MEPPHYLQVLDAKAPRADNPPGFQGQLWAPQATLLAELLRLEASPFLVQESGFLHTRVARVAAKFSFGKTVLCVALVCASKAPLAFPHVPNFPLLDGGERETINRLTIREFRGTSSYRFVCHGRGIFPDLTLRYKSLITTTLVVSAASVITQWETIIREFAPHLTYFTIDNVMSLRAYRRLFESGKARGFDLVLLKAGSVTASYVLPGEKKSAKKSRTLTEALSTVTEGHTWARMIVDDYDTIRINRNDVFLPAFFTWVISATNRKGKSFRDVVKAPTAREFLRRNAQTPIMAVAGDFLFEQTLKLQCDPKYVDEHINTTAMRFRQIVVQGGREIGILRDLGVDDEVIEMATAGALQTAAERLNTVAASVGDLIERVLSKRTEKYREAASVLDLVNRAAAAAVASKAPPNTNDEALAIRRDLKACNPSALQRVGAMGAPLRRGLETLREWATKERLAHGTALQRMRENVRQDECMACKVPVEGESYVVNCCQIVVCAYCILVDGRGGAKEYITHCPACSTEISPRKHLIYVGPDLDLLTALDDKAFLAEKDAPPQKADEEKKAPEPREGDGDFYDRWNANPRLKALLQLVRGAPLEGALEDKEAAPFVKGLLSGRRDSPHPAGAPHKNLVFAMHSESARQISKGLLAAGIPFLRFGGSRKEKDRAVRAFKEGEVGVLLVTTSSDCSGVHLPEATRVVFYHHHRDGAVAQQGTGRAQRGGRVHNLEVVRIVSEGEVEHFD